MTATNMCSNFGSKWSSPPLKIAIKLYFQLDSHADKIGVEGGGESTIELTHMQLRHEVSLPGLHGSFWKLFCSGRLDRHQCLL